MYLHCLCLGCPQRPIDPLPLGLGICGAVVLVGIIIIILWKVLSFIYDTVEYSKYEADIKDPIWEKVRGFKAENLEELFTNKIYNKICLVIAYKK